MRKLCSVVLFVCIAVMASGIAHAEEPLTAAEVRAALLGNTGVGTTSRGDAYWVYRNPNGEQVLQTDGGFSDEGEWRITDDGELCSKWEKIRKGEELCLKFYRLGEDRYKYFKPNGDEAQFKVIKGNPENL